MKTTSALSHCSPASRATPDATPTTTVAFLEPGRLSREGIRKTIACLQQLEALDVQFRSYTGPYLSTENELVRHILLGVLSYFAEYEAKKISRRTNAAFQMKDWR